MTDKVDLLDTITTIAYDPSEPNSIAIMGIFLALDGYNFSIQRSNKLNKIDKGDANISDNASANDPTTGKQGESFLNSYLKCNLIDGTLNCNCNCNSSIEPILIYQDMFDCAFPDKSNLSKLIVFIIDPTHEFHAIVMSLFEIEAPESVISEAITYDNTRCKEYHLIDYLCITVYKRCKVFEHRRIIEHFFEQMNCSSDNKWVELDHQILESTIKGKFNSLDESADLSQIRCVLVEIDNEYKLILQVEKETNLVHSIPHLEVKVGWDISVDVSESGIGNCKVISMSDDFKTFESDIIKVDKASISYIQYTFQSDMMQMLDKGKLMQMVKKMNMYQDIIIVRYSCDNNTNSNYTYYMADKMQDNDTIATFTTDLDVIKVIKSKYSNY